MTGQSYLTEVLETLWPGGPDTPGDARDDVRLLALPHPRSPRVVLPVRPWRVSAGALRHYRTSATGLRRLGAEAGSLGFRVGMGELLPGRGVRRPSANGIDTHLSEVLGHRVHVSLYVGPQRAVQKPVLQILDDRGHPVAFAKIALNPLTTRLIRNEAAALTRLQTADLRTVRVPRVLHHGSWNSHEVVVQEALVPSSAPGVPPDLVAAAAREVAAVDGLQEDSDAEGSYVAGLRSRLAALPDTAHTRALGGALEALPSGATPRITTGTWHGDWASWNMARSGPQVLVWDWEGFRGGVPVGFDACHHHVCDQVTFGGISAVQAFRGLLDHLDDVLGPMGVEPDARAWTALLYAVELATSYVENGEAEVAGTSLSRLDDWLDDALRSGRAAVEQGVHS
jgi:hypothetical protein